MRRKQALSALVWIGIVAASGTASMGLTGCDKPSHENVDKWMRTKKGPDKLRAALSESSDPDVAAHAAANLVRKQLDSDARARLEKMSPERRSAIVVKLVPRLWDMARLEGEMTVPGGEQTMAKDLLFDVRGMVPAAERTRIDGYLLDWYTSGFYDARAQPGRHPGAEVIRAIGAPAGDRLIPIADSILAKAMVGTQRLKISEELLLALAASGSPATVKYLLDLSSAGEGAGGERGDKTLGDRALSALYRAYVDPGGLFPVVDPAPLVPHVQTLVGFAKAENKGRVVNDAIALVKVTGRPACVEPLLDVVAYPHDQLLFRYIGASAALQCGGAAAIAPVLAAFPENGSYMRQQMGGAVWTIIAKLEPRAEVIAALRELAKRDGKLAKWIAIEALAVMASREDLPLVQSMSSDRRKLTGYWGDQSDVPAKDRKAEPTLGERAVELVAEMQAGKGS